MSQDQNPANVVSLSVSVGVHCHPGKVREDNQDRISRFATPLGDFFLVADGVGGHHGGAEASRIVAQGFARHLAIVEPGTPLVDALRIASNKVNAEIYEAGRSGDPQLHNMGSTVAFALLQNDQAVIGHVGDSRVYHIRDERLVQVMRDHSAVQKLLDHGLVTESQARNHPDASVLTRSFGQKPEVEVDFDTVTLIAGDGLLLCSDGLWGCVTDEEIREVVTSPSLTPQACADALLELALNAGGPDNISIEYLRFSSTAAPPTTPIDGRSHAGTKTVILAGAAVVLLIAAGLSGWKLSERYRGRAGQQAAQPTTQPASTNPRPNQTPGTIPAPGPEPPAHTPPIVPPAPGPDHSSVPGGPGQQPPPQSSAPASSGAVGVLLPRSRSADVLASLGRVSRKQVRAIDDPNHTCAAQVQDKAVVYYKPGAANSAVAAAVGAAWSEDTRLKEITPAVQNACGTYDLIVLPAKNEL